MSEDGDIPLGKVIGEPINLYHSRDALSCSKLKVFGESALKYHKRFVAKTSAGERTDALDTGAAFHALMQGDEEYARLCVVNTQFRDFRTDAAKNWRDGNVARGLIVLSPADHANLHRMRLGAIANPTVRLMLEGAEREVTWRTKIGTTVLQCRTDVWNERGVTLPNGQPTGPFILDWKSLPTLTDNAFVKAVGNYAYDFQFAYYTELVAMVTGMPSEQRPEMYFVACESDDPWEAEVYRLDEDTRTAARAAMLLTLRKFRHSVKNNDWPHRPNGITTIDLPRWRIEEIAREIDEGRRALE